MDDLATWVAALESGSQLERRAAAEQLTHLGEGARSAAVILIRAAGDGDEQTSEWAVAALEELGPPPTSQVEALTQLLHGTPTAAFWAATLLGRLPSAPQQTISELVWALEEHPATEVRHRAAWALGKLRAPEAQGPLERAAASADQRLRRIADQARREIGP
jgi:HEAT repeat protein